MKPKFRAWHKELKKMFDVKSLVFTIGTATIASRDDIVPSRNVGFDELIIMQSTGLFDKNGKEIFEGDVLKTYDGELTKVVWNKELACWEAEFLGEIVDLSEVADVKCNRSYCEIVGNIWENKEFLEEE